MGILNDEDLKRVTLKLTIDGRTAEISVMSNPVGLQQLVENMAVHALNGVRL